MITKLVHNEDRYGFLAIGERHAMVLELVGNVDVVDPKLDLPSRGVAIKASARASIDGLGHLHLKLHLSQAKLKQPKPPASGAGGAETPTRKSGRGKLR
jgi:hypothetical protein